MSRYIDADKLIDNIKLAELPVISRSVLTECLIPNQPTADVRENVRGEWIDRGKDMMIRWQCSECGRKDTHIYNFCPNCGAEMRHQS